MQSERFALETSVAAENPDILRTLYAVLPGPDRTRTASPYGYRIAYRNPRKSAVGCVMTWAVTGGRMPYQIALERDEAGTLRIHCTCADAVFRAEDARRFCKHVRGLLLASLANQGGDAGLPLGA